MAVALESVVKQLTDSGIIAQGKLENFVPPKAHPTSVEALIAELVKENHLTKFQAAQVSAGRAKSLILGEYTILDKIGAGGMGQVFKALHRRMDRLVAIKTLPAATMKDAAAVARFEREVKAAAKLRHPNVVAADDAGQANGVHFLVMEYVDGQDLSALVKKNGPFPIAKAVNYVLQAARGLEFAHKKGVVHRDIKPANLLLDSEGTVKILDMGLARIESEANAAAQAELTGTGAVMGTVDYMAPEQGVSTKDADARADIYSLGCTLHYLIVGKATYGGESVMAKLLAHHHQPIPNLRELNFEVPEQVQAVFKKMVAKTVEDRYQTMTEVITDLERLGGNSGTVNDPYAATAALDNAVLSAVQNIELSRTTAKAAATKQVAATKPGSSKQPPWNNIKVLIGAGAAGLALLLGVILIVRDKDDKEVARIDAADGTKVTLPAGGSVEVQGSVPANSSTTTSASPTKLFMHDPAFPQWMAQVQALPADEQVKAVSKKLVELNPGFDGKIADWSGNLPTIEKGMVKGIVFVAENVTDISPVRALASMRYLSCSGVPGRQGALSDLSPLKGMSLVNLHFYSTRVSDISPLQGMQLTEVSCGATQVSDLSPLKGMPLTKMVCDLTLVSDLSPLAGMNLTEFAFTPKNITTGLDVIRQMKSLKTIGLRGTSDKFSPDEFWKRYDAGEFGKPYALAKLAYLDPAFQAWIKATQALPAEQQIEAVRKKLMELNPGFDGKVFDGSGKSTPKIENGVVTELNFSANDVTDISPVRALMGLKTLGCNGTGGAKGLLSNLLPLEGMTLVKLGVSETQVSDLSPLESGHSLQYLNVKGTNVTAAAVAARQKALPNCNIVWDDPAKATTPQVAIQTADQERTLAEWVLSVGGRVDVKPVAGPSYSKGISVTVIANLPVGPIHVTACKFASDPTSYKVTDADIERLLPLSRLSYLSLGNSHITDDGLEPLKKFTQLDTLLLNGTKITDAGLQTVAQIKSLRYLTLTKIPAITDTGVRELRTLPNLVQLLVDGTKVTTEVFVELPNLTQVSVDAKQALALPNLDKLSVLDIDSPDDACIEHICKLKLSGLKSIGFYGNPKVSPQKRAELSKAFPNCEFKSGAATSAASAKKPLTDINSPEFQAWIEDVQAMPAQQQIEAVSKKLMELNPGFDGKLTGGYGNGMPRIEKGVVTECGMVTDKVIDISPVRALVRLRVLACSGPQSGGRSNFSDLSPLKGMSLTTLRISSTMVSDLSPLEGMRLIGLGCYATQVSDLAPLAGMPLESMTAIATQITDLSPLEDCKSLTYLSVKSTHVTAAQVAALQKALPNCKIEWDDPAKPTTP
jgi:serine/threonine protein kinase/Leucine-rich repeat (LRR) protein